MTTLCGIDPGASGGFAWKWPGCKAVACKMPATDGDIVKLVKHIIVARENMNDVTTVFYLENMVKFAGKMCSQSTIATYGAGFGMLKGCIQYSGSTLYLVPPQRWLAALGLGKKGDRTSTQWKNHLKAHAQRIFPHLDVTLATADALCILHYAMEQNKEFTGL
jgi:hypothetical protein